MDQLSIEQFENRIDSLYRLVVIAAHRAKQLNRPDARSLLAGGSQKKPTTAALEEILDGKVSYRTGGSDEEDFLE